MAFKRGRTSCFCQALSQLQLHQDWLSSIITVPIVRPDLSRPDRESIKIDMYSKTCFVELFPNGRRPQLFSNGRRHQLFFQMEYYLNFFQMEDDLNLFFQMEDDQLFSNGRWLEKDDLNLYLLIKDNLRGKGRSNVVSSATYYNSAFFNIFWVWVKYVV